MNRFYYDLHSHSCLSPCADSDNTPNNLAGMASISGLQIVALTDHNSCKNCPAFFSAAERYGLIPIAGMELTTSEDIHVVCLFETLADALAFDEALSKRRMLIKNRPDIFGEQQIMNENDEIIGIEEHLLSVATTVSVEEVCEFVSGFSGICYPAHIDRSSNGIVAILGDVPQHLDFSCVEFRDVSSVPEYVEKYKLSGKKIIISSDAHCLTDIRDGENYFELDADLADKTAVTHLLFKHLRSRL